MKILTTISTVDIERVPAAAADLERRGFDGVTTQENRHDPFLPLALAASATERLELVTNLVIAFPRSPMVVANVAWDLQRLSSGGFHLGLGTQVRGHIVRRFSSTWTAPVAQMRDYVQALRAIFRTWQEGVPLAFEGEYYRFSLMTPNFDPGPLVDGPPPILIGAVGPAMLRLAATACDGVLLHPFVTPDFLAQRTLPLLENGLTDAGRTAAGFRIFGGGFVATGADDEAVHRTREWVRTRVAFYGSTPAYHPVLHHHDLGDLGEQLHHLSRHDGWDQMPAAVSDEVVDLFCVTAGHDELAVALERRYGGLVDAFSVADDLPADLVADLRRIPTRSDGLSRPDPAP